MTPASASPPQISEAEYLRRERERDDKCEFENGKEIPVGGATKEHNIITGNIFGLLWLLARENDDLFVYSNDMRVYTPFSGKYYYPDIAIAIGEEQFQDKEFDTLLNPSVLIEVLSENTAEKDRTTKFEAYRSIEAFREYLLVAQDQYRVEGFYENPNGEWIIREPVEGSGNTFSFKTIELELPLKEVYNKVEIRKSE